LAAAAVAAEWRVMSPRVLLEVRSSPGCRVGLWKAG
jgi:hypothetical protein